ncbi:Uncharacterised protein [Shigella flexneri]|nr:Uncharacterised protein [Shigella flexneri]
MLVRIGVVVVGPNNGPTIGNWPAGDSTYLRNTILILLSSGIVLRQRSLNIFRAGVMVIQLYQTVFIPTVFNAGVTGRYVIQTCIVLNPATQSPTLGDTPVGVACPHQ